MDTIQTLLLIVVVVLGIAVVAVLGAYVGRNDHRRLGPEERAELLDGRVLLDGLAFHARHNEDAAALQVIEGHRRKYP